MEGKPGRGAGGPAVITLALVVLAMTIGGGFPLTDDPYPHYRAVPWLDLAWLALIVAAVPLAIERIRDRRFGIGTALWGGIVALLAVSLAVHPSAIGAQTLLRAVGILAAAIVVAALAERERAFILGVLGVVVALETGIALAQVVAGAPLGLPGEAPGLSPIRGNAMVARGTFDFEYIYAGFGLVAAMLFVPRAISSTRRAPWLALSTTAIAAVGMTFSRTALVGYLAGLIALVPGALRWPGASRYRLAIAFLIVGVAIPALALRDGWVSRASEGAGTSQQAVTERAGLTSLALTLIAENPVVGVGTGRYVAAVRERFPNEPGAHAVHNVPLYLAAEAGIAAGVLAIALGAVLGWRALRSGPAPLALYLVFVPALLVDIYPYITAQGGVLMALWLGGLDAVGATASAADRGRG